jgi:recombination protein RecR
MKSLGSIDRLVSCLNKLPGIGRRSAQRIAFELAARRDNLLNDLTASLQEVARGTMVCSLCGGITRSDENPCPYCSDSSRDSSILCVVETPMDILLIESTGSFSGRYHVLGGKISPMRGLGTDDLKIDALRRRLKTEKISEVILALNSDVESDATASMLKDLLNGTGMAVSRPAMGMPAGSGIAFIDRITLNNAIQNRQAFQSTGRKEKGGRKKTVDSSQKSEVRDQ